MKRTNNYYDFDDRYEDRLQERDLLRSRSILDRNRDCDDDDDDYEFDDDSELYEVECPNCGDTILLDESIIEEGTMNCPNCDTLLEFDDENLTIEDIIDEIEE